MIMKQRGIVNNSYAIAQTNCSNNATVGSKIVLVESD